MNTPVVLITGALTVHASLSRVDATKPAKI